MKLKNWLSFIYCNSVSIRNKKNGRMVPESWKCLLLGMLSHFIVFKSCQNHKCPLASPLCSGALCTTKTTAPGTFGNQGSVLRGPSFFWCLVILRPYGTIWQNFIKDPSIHVLSDPRLFFVLRFLRKWRQSPY